MAKRAAKLVETPQLPLLLWRTLIRGHLSNVAYRGQHRDAPLEPLSGILPARGEAELPILSGRVAAFAALRIEDVIRHLPLALVCCRHAVQRGGCILCRRLSGQRPGEDSCEQARANRRVARPPEAHQQCQKQRACSAPPNPRPTAEA